MRRLAAIALCLAAGASAAEEITAADLRTLPPADVYVLGEVHDNPLHHAHQASAVAAIAPSAVVFEMLTEAQAGRIRPEDFASAGRLAAALGWESSGWPDFAMYYPVFVAARDAVLIGGALDRSLVRRAVREGAAAVFGDGAASFLLNEALPEAEQAAREAGQMAAHCDALPPEMLPGMVEAQRLRDAALAKAALDGAALTGGPVVIITGNGHARRDWGVPAMLARARPDLRVLSIAQFESGAPENPPYDLWLVTEAVDRGDPCDTFRR